jgi:hypothetical protein
VIAEPPFAVIVVPNVALVVRIEEDVGEVNVGTLVTLTIT